MTTWILILWIGNVDASAITTIEFNSEQKCMEVGELAIKKFNKNNWAPIRTKYICVLK